MKSTKTEAPKKEVCIYPCLRQDDAGNVYMFTKYCGAPAVYITPETKKQCPHLFTTGNVDDYEPFHGTITITED